jgi:ABC-type multidrug transport system fused ATPase/permease subunit
MGDRRGRKLLRRLVSESPRLLALSVATAVAQSALLLPIALVVRDLFNKELPAGETDEIAASGALILLLYAASAALGVASRLATLHIAAGVSRRFRRELIAKLYALPQEWHDLHPAGPVNSLVVEDAERVEEALGDIASPLIPACIVAVSLSVAALVLSPPLALALLLVVPASMATVHMLGRRLRKNVALWLDATRVFSARLQLTLRTMTLTKAEGAEEAELLRMNEPLEEVVSRMQTVGEGKAWHVGMQNAIGAVAGSLVLVVGGIAVANGDLSLGDLLAFYAVLALLLRQLQLIGPGVGNAVVALEAGRRLEILLETPDEEPYAGGGATKLEFRGEIAIEHVGFGYSNVPVLHDLDLVIRPSERIAVLGPNGAGKSTLVSLVMGFYRPHSGRVLADGVPFEELDIRHLRRQIGVALQDPVLFPGTIRENIAFGRPDATDAEVAAAAETSTAAAFIARLPSGYETRIGDEGVGLSGGQRQRVAIARAVLGAPGLLVLDEPTTYLDEDGVAELIEKLDGLPQKPTIMLVTHDPAVAAYASRVIEIRHGTVVSDSGAASLSSG